MVKKIFSIIITSPLFIFLVSCSGGGSSVEFASSIDFLSSKLVVLGQGVANGSSYLYVEVHAINSNGSPITNFTPELTITAGDGAVVHSCNSTNSIGVARCAITSSMPGIKTMNLSNTNGVAITENATFVMPIISKTIISSVPGSTINNISGGHHISASLSTMKAPLKYTDSSGVIVYSTVQGVILSDSE